MLGISHESYRKSQKKVPTFENSYHQEYFTYLNVSNSNYVSNFNYFPLGGRFPSQKSSFCSEAQFRLKVELVSTFEQRSHSASQSDGWKTSLRAEYSA